MYGRDYRYANTRLTETIIFQGDRAVYCREVTDDGRASVIPLRDMGDGGPRVVVPLAELDVKPRRLGYVNYEGSVCYVMRVPKRRDYRQGLRGNTMSSMGPLHVHDIPLHRLSDMLEGQYPSFEQALENCKQDRNNACAWHREWAVLRDGNLLHKGESIVGKVVENQPMLSEEYQWLQESLRDSL